MLLQGGEPIRAEVGVMKILGWALAFLMLLSGWSAASPSKIQILPFDPKALPQEIRYKGEIVAGARWLDKEGENLLLLCETGPLKSPRQELGEDDAKMAHLYGYHYVKDRNHYTLLWKLYDYMDFCRFDIEATFLPNSLTITDLDDNGIAESTFLYRVGCRSDVHPLHLKLIMHEGKAKYAIRGETLVYKGLGGHKTIDPSFYRAPKAFLDHAFQQWNAFVEEKFGE
jgi:hypothetical protein